MELIKVEIPNPSQLRQRIIDVLEEGNQSPLKLLAYIKLLEQTGKDFEVLKDAAMVEFSKIKEGKSYKGIESLGAEVVEKTTSNFDFTCCMDPVYDALVEEMETIKVKLENRKAFLKTVEKERIEVDPETGEVFSIFPPCVKKSNTLAFTWKKK